MKGITKVQLQNGSIKNTEIYWYEAHGKGGKGYKIKINMINKKMFRNQYVVCISDSEPQLEIRKIYQVLEDKTAEKEEYLRVIDDSGEDYLYPSNFFMEINLSQKIKKSLSLV